MTRSGILTPVLLGLSLACSGFEARADEPLAARFKAPPAEAGMTIYWVWFGSAITEEMIDRDLANMKAAGISGTVLLPVYPMSLDDPATGVKNLRFLSPEYLAMLGHAAKRSGELGMTLDVTIGTGWPYGGPWITPELAARMIRMRPTGGKLAPGEEVVGVFGDKEVVSMPTGMQVKRPSLGNEGPVFDHYDPAALQRHLEVAGEKLWGAMQDRRIRFWVDSLEVFGANWTPGFLDDFRTRRGYDLAPHLDKLFGEADADARQIRHDYWLTLSELAAENFLRPLQQWCHGKGVKLRGEAYGQPPVMLGSYRYVDEPCGEHYEWRMLNASRWASSGGRLFGKNVIGSEAWTQLNYPNRLGDSLEQLKLCSDMHFVSGVNALMGSAYISTHPSAGTPGWLGYWGPFINHNQTWWPHFPLFSRYVQRTSWLLQQGLPVADVALYLPADDVFAETPASSELNLYMVGIRHRLNDGPADEFGLANAISGDTPVVSTIIRSGYSFDAIDRSVMPDMEAADGHLRMGQGDYRVVILPNITGLPLADLEKLAAFVKAGGTVIATRRLPNVGYGGRDHAEKTEALRRLVSEMFAAGGYGRGRAVLVPDERESLGKALHAALEPDLQLAAADRDVAFVHRRLPGEDFYFVANLGSEEKTLRVELRGNPANIERWDPMTGEVHAGWDGTLRLDPFGSMVLRAAAAASGAARPTPPLVREQQELPIAWTLAAEGRKTIGPLATLVSWTEIPDLANFSGTATYSGEFEFDPLGRGRVELDLGTVREIAEVAVNGRPAGVAWKRPYRLDITQLVKPGANAIEVKVTNLWINAMFARPEPDFSKLNAAFGERFPAPLEWKTCRPCPSGLLGPVVLQTELPPR